jgi:phage terminase large subunit GpA-like protein
MTRNNRERARLIPVGVDDAKTTIYRHLQLAMPEGGADFPTGYMHFPNTVDESYFSMLTAEKQVIRRDKGFPRKVWEKKSASARNEALDCRVYSMAALAILNPNWEALEERHNKRLALVSYKIEDEAEKVNAPPIESPRPRGGIKVVGQFG